MRLFYWTVHIKFSNLNYEINQYSKRQWIRFFKEYLHDSTIHNPNQIIKKMHECLQATVPQLVCPMFQIFLLVGQGLNLRAKMEPERKGEADISRWFIIVIMQIKLYI